METPNLTKEDIIKLEKKEMEKAKEPALTDLEILRRDLKKLIDDM
jgi:hypothetical protein